MKRKLVLVLIVISLFCSMSLLAATPDNKAAAKAEFEKARAMGMGDPKAAAEAYRKAIDLDPDFYDAHHYYILTYPSTAGRSGTEEERKTAREKAEKELEDLYQGWAKEHPDRAVYQWALGILYEYKDPDRAVRHYQQAVKIDPKYAPAYDMLGIGAEAHGDLELSRQYHRKAVESWPDDSTFWRHYVDAWHYADTDKAKEVALQMSEKFPNEGPGLVAYVANLAHNEKQSQEIYELLRQKYPKQTASRLPALFSMYLKSDRAKALALAQEMVKTVPENKDWPVLVNYAQTVIDADSLIAQGKAGDAIAALDKITLPRYGADRRVLDITHARAVDANGLTEKAYGDLLNIFAKTPSDEVRAALLGYGKKLDKDAKQVDAEVWAQRSANAKPGVAFSLVNYTTGKTVSLEQYKGKVFLVNFWYPKCGPCRGEFQFLQAVLDKYKSRGFEILAINGHPPEDEWVMPLIKGWRLGFLPLKGDDEVVKAYKVRGFPSNFLYGPDGRIYYQPPGVQGLSAQRELELQIEALLAKSATKTE